MNIITNAYGIAYHPERHTHLKSRTMLGDTTVYGPHYDTTVSMFLKDINSFIPNLRKAGFSRYGMEKYLYVHYIDLETIPDGYFNSVRLESTTHQFDFYEGSTSRELAADDYVTRRDEYLRTKGVLTDRMSTFIRTHEVDVQAKLTHLRCRESIIGGGPYRSFINKEQYASIIPHLWCSINQPLLVTKSCRLEVDTGKIDLLRG